MRFYTTESLGLHQQLTPEGYLAVKDVPIARTGTMFYAAGEVPVSSVDGIIRIQRAAEDVFSPNTIASFEGKPVTIDHPNDDVNPGNWSELAKGLVTNVRRGAGLDDDCLVADLLITDAAAIELVKSGLREVSCGYDADYEEIQPGEGRQHNILGNHLALVEKGRCGPRCAIGDSMKKIKLLDKLRAAWKARDEKAFEETLAETETTNDDAESKKDDDKKKDDEKETHDALSKVLDAIKALDSRMSALETKDKKSKDDEVESAEEEDADSKKDDGAATADSAELASAAQDTLARAEVLAPGLHMPTVDAKEPGKFRDALCGLKRKALTQAFEGKYRDSIALFGNPEPFKTMTCDAIAHAFVGASEIVRRENNASSAQINTFDAGTNAKKVATAIGDINRRNAEFWKRT